MELKDCTLCARGCHVNRSAGQKGYCGFDDRIYAARAALHMWEEPVISGKRGSGTVFFSGCSLKCVYCQNHSIAIGSTGKEVSIERLADIFLELQEKGAHNINLVTPTHYVPQITRAIYRAKCSGLSLPIVYNTASYENEDTIRMLEGMVDIYLADLKYKDSNLSLRYSNAPDYFKVAASAIAQMYNQAGIPKLDTDGMLKKGLIVRHLVLPGFTEDSKNVIKYLYDTYENNIFYSIMNQYTPLPHVASYPEINRRVTESEYDEVVDYAVEIGVENGFIQEGETAEESFIPEFDMEGI